jgi:hypothetical protein
MTDRPFAAVIFWASTVLILAAFSSVIFGLNERVHLILG